MTDKAPPDPADLVDVAGHERARVPLHRLAAAAWAALMAEARADGIEAPLLLPVSGYRSPEEQDWLWRGALRKYGDPDEACLWVARPGTSAHQSGRAIDCHLGDPIESEFADRMRDTPAYRWLVAHAERFGFFPYELEPWHWEYNPPWEVSGGAGEYGGPMSRTAGPSLLASAVERSVLDRHDGRSGAQLERVRLDDGTRLVVKRARPSADLTMRLSGDSEGRELCLWATGVLDRLPAGVGHAVVGGWRDSGDVVVVMRDLGGAVIGWHTVLRRDDCRRIFAAAASMHAAFADRRIDGLCPLATRLSLFDPAGLRSLPVDDHPIAGYALRGWERFAELVPADVADAVTALHRDPGPLAVALAARGTTLAHGDLWLVNAAFEPGQVVLLDWGLATAAPGAFDFATFLMGASGVEATGDDLLDDVRTMQGGRHDETALRLALLAAVVDLGWNKALDAADHDDDAIRAREAAELSWWVDQARRTLDLGLL